MNQTTQSGRFQPVKAVYVLLLCCVLAFLCGITWFSVFYFTTGRETLKNWFFSLNDSFYHKEVWTEQFFTDAVKEQSNMIALVACGVAVLLLVYIILNRNKLVELLSECFHVNIPYGWKWYAAVAALAVFLGGCSWASMAPAYDEIFSAVNCAQIHPFQTIAYYMLPNNHMYFNFLNNVLFSWWWTDPVYSGRVISLLAWVGTLLVVFTWLYRMLNNHAYAFVALLPIALQFTAYAMAGQARAYGTELFCGWLSFVSMLAYVQKQDKKYLFYNLLANVVAFTFIPAWLSVYLCQLLVVVITMVIDRKIRWQYFKCQFIAGAFVFLFYLPAFCFSGIAAFTENGFVKPLHASWQEFWPVFRETTGFFIGFCFSELGGEKHPVNFVLFLLPLSLFFSGRREFRLVALTYVSLCVAYAVLTLKMRHHPFSRNMIVHYNLLLAFAVLALYFITSKVAETVRSHLVRTRLMIVLFLLPLVAFAGYEGYRDKTMISFHLYYNDVNIIYKGREKELALIPPGSSIGFSAEAFYLYYYFRQHGYRPVNREGRGNEQYFIRHTGDLFPPGCEGAYELIFTSADNYEFFRRTYSKHPE